MRLLLDTHAFLWFAGGDAALSPAARRRIEDPSHEKYLSIASVWEMAIKVSVGKLDLALPIHDLIHVGAVENGIRLLEIKREHVLGVSTLPLHHRDPFDRLLIAQAMSESLSIVGRDPHFDAYAIRRIW